MTTPIELNRTSLLSTALPPEVSREILADMTAESVVQRLGRRVRMPGTGLAVPVVVSDPEAEWVEETALKPVSRSVFDSIALRPSTLAVIEPFSKQFLRDLPGLYNECRTRLPGALAKKFDASCFGFAEGPGEGFTSIEGAPVIDIEGDTYGGLLNALASVVGSGDGSDVTAWALSPLGEIAVLAARTDDGNPLFTPNAAEGGVIGQLLGRPVVKSSTAADPDNQIVGVCGDFSGSAIWGMVGTVTLDVSGEATLVDSDNSVIALWQRNMIAIRAEVEISFAPRDPSRFAFLKHSGDIPARTPRKRPPAKTTE